MASVHLLASRTSTRRNSITHTRISAPAFFAVDGLPEALECNLGCGKVALWRKESVRVIQQHVASRFYSLSPASSSLISFRRSTRTAVISSRILLAQRGMWIDGDQLCPSSPFHRSLHHIAKFYRGNGHNRQGFIIETEFQAVVCAIRECGPAVCIYISERLPHPQPLSYRSERTRITLILTSNAKNLMLCWLQIAVFIDDAGVYQRAE